MTKKTLAERLAKASAGLVLPSESDSPFEVVEWKGEGERLDHIGAFAKLAHLPPHDKMETLDAEAFFLPLCTDQEWHDEEGKKAVEKYRKLWRLLSEELEDLRVYRFGRIQVVTFIVGRSPHGDVVGLKATQVET